VLFKVDPPPLCFIPFIPPPAPPPADPAPAAGPVPPVPPQEDEDLDPSQLAAEYAALLPLHPVSVNLYFEYILHSNYDVQPPAHVPFVLPLARRPFDPAWQVHDLGSLNVRCLFIGWMST
jgi:hypothetical protein